MGPHPMTLKELLQLIVNIAMMAFGLFLYREGNQLIGAITTLVGLVSASRNLSEKTPAE